MSDDDDKPSVASPERDVGQEDAPAAEEPTAEVAPGPGAEAGGPPPAAEKSKNLAQGLVFGAFALAGLGMLGLYLALSPSGDPVGQVDLLNAQSSVIIDGTAGDEITFQSRITTGLSGFAGPTSKNRANSATNAMQESTLTVFIVDPDGAEQTSRCELWGGSRGTDRNDTVLTENNVINDCEVVLKSAGKHTVRAEVKWHPALAIKAAQLTVYRDPP